MSHVLRPLKALLVAGAGLVALRGPAARAEDIPLRSGKIVEVDRGEALATVLATPGVVLVDCFADW